MSGEYLHLTIKLPLYCLSLATYFVGAKMSKELQKKDEEGKEQVLCAQCGRPALMQEEGVPLCIDCCAKLEYINQIRHSRLIDQLNYNSAKLDADLGLGISSPKMANFRPQPPSGTLFLNNISIDRSTIGIINTGTIQSLDNALTIINDQHQVQLADNLKNFTEAVIQSNELAEEIRQEVIEELSFIADQITESKQERKSATAKTILKHIPTLLQAASSLMALWKQLEPFIISALK